MSLLPDVTAAVDASAAPRRERGVRSRAGNAMERTRAAVLDGAVRAVEKHGVRRTTMSDIATLAGIAKGTLYNHFRTKEAVFAATVDAGIGALADECTAAAVESLADGLALAADRLGSHPALRRIAADEPAVLAALTSIADSPTWVAAREGVRSVLAAGGRDAADTSVEVALRWLVSFIGAPGSEIDRQASLVAAALPAAPPPTAAPSPPAADTPPQTFDDGSVQLSL